MSKPRKRYVLRPMSKREARRLVVLPSADAGPRNYSMLRKAREADADAQAKEGSAPDTTLASGDEVGESSWRYYGFTHFVPIRALGLWRRFMCPRGVHAFDEVFTMEGNYLHCDACELVVDIAAVDYTYVKDRP